VSGSVSISAHYPDRPVNKPMNKESVDAKNEARRKQAAGMRKTAREMRDVTKTTQKKMRIVREATERSDLQKLTPYLEKEMSGFIRFGKSRLEAF
jgi:hypothetical protein